MHGGTLVLYDSENLRVFRGQKPQVSFPNVTIEDITREIKRVLPDTRYKMVAFLKRKRTKADQQKEEERFSAIGYDIVTKVPVKKKNRITIEGRSQLYEYVECDMDGEIVHAILTLGPKFNRIVLISGDKDMKVSLDYVKERDNVEIWVVSRKERLSMRYASGNTLTIDELMRGYNGEK